MLSRLRILWANCLRIKAELARKGVADDVS